MYRWLSWISLLVILVLIGIAVITHELDGKNVPDLPNWARAALWALIATNAAYQLRRVVRKDHNDRIALTRASTRSRSSSWSDR